jgi:hypothetical protein
VVHPESCMSLMYVESRQGQIAMAAGPAAAVSVGWAMSERMSSKRVCDALQMAYWRLGTWIFLYLSAVDGTRS